MKIKSLFTALLVLAILLTSSPAMAETLPEAYDPRPGKNVSSVKNQQPFGTCWAFAGLSTLESFLIKDGWGEMDLSEEALIWWACGQFNITGAGWANKTKNDGGYARMVTGYLTSGAGPVMETQLPYNTDISLEWYLPEDYPGQAKDATGILRVTDILYPDTSQQSEIKECILQYGAVFSSWLESPHRDDGIPAYWSLDEGYTTHAVCIVGWDDNYPKENFLPIDGAAPLRDGAWLVKNSYGTEMGEDGFIYISYEDQSLFSYDDTFSVMQAKKVGKETVLQLDEYGATDLYTQENLTCANVFDFSQGGDMLTAVTLMHKSPNADFLLEYAPADATGAPDLTQKQTICSGTLAHSGYETIVLAEPFPVPDDTGAILLTISGTAVIGVDASTLTEYGRPMFNASIQSNESFLIQDGVAIDAGAGESPMNFSLKAVTENVSSETPLPSEPDASDTPNEPENAAWVLLVLCTILLVIVLFALVQRVRKRSRKHSFLNKRNNKMHHHTKTKH